MGATLGFANAGNYRHSLQLFVVVLSLFGFPLRRYHEVINSTIVGAESRDEAKKTPTFSHTFDHCFWEILAPEEHFHFARIYGASSQARNESVCVLLRKISLKYDLRNSAFLMIIHY